MKFTLSNNDNIQVVEFFVPNEGAVYGVVFMDAKTKSGDYGVVYLNYGKDNRPHKMVAEDIKVALELIAEENGCCNFIDFFITCEIKLPKVTDVPKYRRWNDSISPRLVRLAS